MSVSVSQADSITQPPIDLKAWVPEILQFVEGFNKLELKARLFIQGFSHSHERQVLRWQRDPACSSLPAVAGLLGHRQHKALLGSCSLL